MTIARAKIPALLFVAAIAAACGAPSPAAPEAEAGAAKRDFPTLFASNCAGCHGADGRDGPAPLLHDATFLALAPDGAIEKTILDGRPGSLMPPFGADDGGPLSKEDARTLADGMRKRWGGSAGASGELPPWTPSGPGDPKAGATVFSKVCARCHGEGGGGGPEAGALSDPAFLSLVSDRLLRRIVITGRADLGMPGYRESGGDAPKLGRPLTPEEISDVVAYLSSLRPATKEAKDE